MYEKLRRTYEGRSVLVTGHTGFKGSWLAAWLSELGAHVVGYSLEPPSKPNLFESINLDERITHITGDVREGGRLVSVFDEHEPEFIFHLAAQPLVRRSYKEPALTYETNVMGTLNVLEAVRKTGSVRVCVIVTTDKCYENKESEHEYKETDPLGGYDPYSSSKGCAELVTASYRRSFLQEVAVSSARSGNVIGCGDWNEDRLVPDCIKALNQGETIMIRNPNAVRPWQYILEPLSGYLLLACMMREDPVKYSGAWNFGPADEHTITVGELVDKVMECWGSGEYEVDSSQNPHEAGLLKLDVGKARRMLGWMPVYGIDEAVDRTVRGYKMFYGGMVGDRLWDFIVGEIREYNSQGDRLGWGYE
ncbi:MAG: CDP-glucose 4,6-dehydratase [Candidatus Altiarchaeota archaeon]